MNGVIQLRQDAAGSAHLDQPGAPAELLARRPQAARHPIREAERPFQPGVVLHPGQWEGMQIAVAAGAGQDRPGGVDGRAVQHTLGDRTRQVYPEATDLAHRRDTRIESGPQIAGAPRSPQGEWLQRHPPEIEHAHPHEVPVAVPETGQDDRGLVPRRLRCVRRIPGRPGEGDPLAVEHHHPIANRLATARNEQVSRDPVHGVLPLRIGPAGESLCHHGGRNGGMSMSAGTGRGRAQGAKAPGVLC